MILKEELNLWLNSSFSDPIATILSKNSHLTRTQLETLLIDVLSEHFAGKQLKYDDKAKLRLTKARISRGSFNRTLRQAKENVVKSIYTVLLLGYLGIFDVTTLDPYLEVSNKLNEYLEAHGKIQESGAQTKDRQNMLKLLREELENNLKRLSDPSEGIM